MGRPTFAGRIQNVTVHVGKEAVLACPVNNIGKYKVRQHHVGRLDILSSSLATMHKGPFINDVYKIFFGTLIYIVLSTQLLLPTYPLREDVIYV